MKRKFLGWLDALPYKPKWLRKMINMGYWTYLLNIQEEKTKRQTKHEKKIRELEEKLIGHINSLRRGLLQGDNDGGMVMRKLTPEEANKKTIEILKAQGVDIETISGFLEFSGLKLPDPEYPKTNNTGWTDVATGKGYSEKKQPRPAPQPKEKTMIMKEVSRTVEQKPKRRTSNGKRKTTAKAHA